MCHKCKYAAELSPMSTVTMSKLRNLAIIMCLEYTYGSTDMTALVLRRVDYVIWIIQMKHSVYAEYHQPYEVKAKITLFGTKPLSELMLYHCQLGTWEQTSIMIVSSNGNIFRVTGPLWVESTAHRWIPHTKASDVKLWCFHWTAPEQTVE